MPKGVPGMTIRVLGMGAGDDAGATSTGATSTLDASAYGGPPFEPTIFTNFLVLCCTPVMQVFLINLVLNIFPRIYDRPPLKHQRRSSMNSWVCRPRCSGRGAPRT